MDWNADTNWTCLFVEHAPVRLFFKQEKWKQLKNFVCASRSATKTRDETGDQSERDRNEKRDMVFPEIFISKPAQHTTR